MPSEIPWLGDHVAIVTGAARGLGRTLAAAFLHAGSAVIATDIDADELERTVLELTPDADGRIEGVACDIADPTQCDAVVHVATSRFGTPTVLIDNAGLGPNHVWSSPRSASGRFWEADPERWLQTIRTNVGGTYAMTRASVPGMVAAGWGRVIIVTTSRSTMAMPGVSAYGVSKVALEAEAVLWADELAGTGVTVNTICPGGPVDTAFVSPATRAAAEAGTATLLRPEVMVAPALWLATPRFNHVSGRRFVARTWDTSLEPLDAADSATEDPVVRFA